MYRFGDWDQISLHIAYIPATPSMNFLFIYLFLLYVYNFFPQVIKGPLKLKSNGEVGPVDAPTIHRLYAGPIYQSSLWMTVISSFYPKDIIQSLL